MQLATFIENVEWHGREEKAEAVERRSIDNRQGAAEVTRKFVLTRQWTETFSITNREELTAELTSKIGSENLGQITSKIEDKTVRESVSSAGTTRTLAEEVVVKVPSGYQTTMEIHWKSYWRVGRATIAVDYSETYRRLLAFTPFTGFLGDFAIAQFAGFVSEALLDPHFGRMEIRFEQADGYSFDLSFASTSKE